MASGTTESSATGPHARTYTASVVALVAAAAGQPPSLFGQGSLGLELCKGLRLRLLACCGCCFAAAAARGCSLARALMWSAGGTQIAAVGGFCFGGGLALAMSFAIALPLGASDSTATLRLTRSQPLAAASPKTPESYRIASRTHAIAHGACQRDHARACRPDFRPAQ